MHVTEERISDGDYLYRSVLEIRDASILDTGYYTCHHKDNEDWVESEHAIKTYVYIEGIYSCTR